MLKLEVEEQEELIFSNFFDTFGSILLLKQRDQDFESNTKSNDEKFIIKNENLDNSRDLNNLQNSNSNSSLISDNSDSTDYMTKTNFKFGQTNLSKLNTNIISELKINKLSINDFLKNPIKNQNKFQNNQNQLLLNKNISHISKNLKKNVKIKLTQFINLKTINLNTIKIFKYKLFKKLVYLISVSNRRILNMSKNYEKTLINELYVILKNNKIFFSS